MAAPAQAPLLRIPAKTTEEVDLAAAVGHLILNSYGQEPKTFSEQLSVLSRARQDAVRGAGSDTTGRDLLYKWFHMLEMLELRFPELRAPFPWKDAFTGKTITQHSLAYEKASVIFNIAAVLSSLGSRTNRIGSSSAIASAAAPSATPPISPTSPKPLQASALAATATAASGTKLAYTCLRQSAGMLSYINENFLHAPSTDMSKDVVRWLVNLQLAQATEVFWERTLEEKKGGNLVTRIASQAAILYGTLAEDSKEWVGRAVFERSWGLLVQTKAKYFASVAQYHRALVDDAAASHGSCLVRLTLAETLAKDAQKVCATFAASVGSSSSSSSSTGMLPSDAGPSLKAVIESHLGIVSARKTQAVKDNDLIYHDILPTESTLPAIEPMAVAQPISIQDIYASPDVQKITGATPTGTPANDLFSALVPLGVHEAASMYSEEKAKLVRNEGNRLSYADGQVDAVLDSLNLPRGLKKFKAEGLQDLLDPGSEVCGWAEEEIQGGGSRGEDGLGTGSDAIDEALRKVRMAREQAGQDLDEASRLLDEEAAQCEKLRVRHGDRWTQTPSGLEAKAMRSDLKTNREALRQAVENDEAIERLWRRSEPMIRVLLGGRESLDVAFAEALAGQGAGSDPQLVDLLQDDSGSEAEREEVRANVSAIESNLAALHRIKKDRNDALTELRGKVQTDDISHILILNRRASSDAQAQLFQQELEKFRPLTQRIKGSQAEQDRVIREIERLWKELNEAPASQGRASEWDKKNASREQLIANLRRAKDANAQVRAGLSKGLAFYGQLGAIAADLRRSARSFVEERAIERSRLQGELDVQERSRGGFGGQTSPQYNPSSSLENAFGRMGVTESRAPASRSSSLGPGPPPPPHLEGYRSGIPLPSPSAYTSPPPPQRPVQASPYDSLDAAFNGGGSLYQASAPPPPVAPPHFASPPPPPPISQQYTFQQQVPPPPGQQLNPYGSSHYASTAPAASAQRQPSLPPPPPQWQSSYSNTGGASLSSPSAQGGPPPAPLPPSSHGGYGAPPPPQLPQPYPHGSGYAVNPAYSSFPPQQPQQRSNTGPPPPPLPTQYGQAPHGYGANQHPQAYAQHPPPPAVQQQQQRWQPPY